MKGRHQLATKNNPIIPLRRFLAKIIKNGQEKYIGSRIPRSLRTFAKLSAETGESDLSIQCNLIVGVFVMQLEMQAPPKLLTIEHMPGHREQARDNANGCVPQMLGMSRFDEQDKMQLAIDLIELATDAANLDPCLSKAYLARARISLQLLTISAQAGGPAEAYRGCLAPWQMKQIAGYVDAHLSSPISNTSLATVARVSRSYFNRAFKATIGQSPHEYVMQRRISKAREMMVTSNEPLSLIALSCGFADQAHFCRIFRKNFFATPSAWRQNATLNGPRDLQRDHSVGS